MNNNIDDCIAELVKENNCDLLILAEYSGNIDSIVSKLGDTIKYIKIPSNGGCKRVAGIIRKNHPIEILQESSKYIIAKIETVSYKVIIGMIHAGSKLHIDSKDQEHELRIFIEDICEQEDKYNTRNTLLIGDFNVNPFEDACVSADILNATPFYDNNENKERIVDNKCYRRFYNPSWKFFASRTPPYTSYFYDNSKIINHRWNAFAQLFLRPHLINAFIFDSFCIVTSTENHILTKNNKPNKKYSDHLPIKLKLTEGEIK